MKDGVTYAKGGEPRPIGNAKLHQKPAWYRKLWKSGAIRITPRTSIVPLLLRLKWKSQPIALIPEHGWCYEVPQAEIAENDSTSSKSKKIDGVASMIDALGGLLQSPIYNFDVN